MTNSDEDRPLPPFNLAWDMAHAADIHHSSRKRELESPWYRPDELEQQRINDEFGERALKAAKAVEDDYYAEIASRDEHYQEVEARYRGILLNKSDLAEYIKTLGDPSYAKKEQFDNAFTTRVWNTIGQYSERTNPRINFGKIVHTGILKPGMYAQRGRANKEQREYLDLDFASLVHLSDDIKSEIESNPNGSHFDDRLDKTRRAILGFVDYIKEKLNNSEELPTR